MGNSIGGAFGKSENLIDNPLNIAIYNVGFHKEGN